MKKIENIFFQFLLGILIFTIAWIVLQGILDYTPILYEFNPILLIIGMIVYFIIIKFVYKKILPKIENNRLIPLVLLIIFTIICIVVGQILKVNPSWDMGSVYNIAVNNVEMGRPDSAYLYQFPNNIGIAIVYTILFKIFNFVGLTDYLTIATVFNSIIVSFSVVLMYLITKKILGNKKALMVLIIAMFTSPLYLYSAIYYTDTLSMFMILLIAYTFIKLEDINENKKVKKALGYILLTFIIYVGMKIKITTIFIVIAYVIYALLNKNYQKLLKSFIVIVPTFILLAIVYNIAVNNIILKDKSISDNVELPLEQWIVMGLKGNGGFSQEEYDYMNQFSTYKEKQEAAREQLKQILSEYDVSSFIKHITEKLKYAWTDGTYFAPEKLRREPVNNTILHEFVLASGKYKSYYKYFPQVMHMSMLIFILIGVCKTIKDKEFKDENVIFYILMLGFITFFLIWENRSRYILTCVPFLMIAQLKGIEIFANYHSKEKTKKEKISN